MIETVLGPISSEELGFTLMHEHMVMVDPFMQNAFPDWLDLDRIVEIGIPQLKRVKEMGVQTIVDPTPINLNRNVKLIARLSAGSGVNLIVATGLYFHDFPLVNSPDPVWLKELFVRDITVGCQGTDIKASFVKCATDAAEISPTNECLLTASVLAAQETGAPIMAHSNPENENGLKQIQLFQKLGMDLGRVIVAHVDGKSIDYALKLLDAGVTIGYDRFGTIGLDNIEGRTQNLMELLRRGYAKQIILGHDSHIYEDFWRQWHTPQYVPQSEVNNFYHISKTVIPRLIELGASQADIDQMVIHNPVRFLNWRN